MVYSVQISTLNNNQIWKKNLSEDEYKKIQSYCKINRIFNLNGAQLIPVRTDCLKNFSIDLLAPTLNYYVLACNYEASNVKLAGTVSALAVDIFTLPFRIITAIPRTVINWFQEEHPLHKYLIEEKANEAIIHSDRVMVTLNTSNSYQDYAVAFSDSPPFPHSINWGYN